MEHKYIFFDIDHTLVSHVGKSHIPPETREAVRLLRDCGHIPAIATGRGAFLAQKVADELGIGLLVCANGAQILNGGKTLYSVPFPVRLLESFREVAGRFPESAAALDERFLYTSSKNQELREYFNTQAGYPCVRPLEDMTGALLCYLMLPPPLPEGCGLFSSPPGSVLLEPMSHFVEARAAGTSKWLGIERVLEHLEASIQDVVTFGDGPNDVEMLRSAPVSVAVGRAQDQAKKAAKFLAEDIDEGGILKACQDIGLIPA
ncbi:MAG: HAD hydrolase family protein [Fretibacterium sp.]|nr:HAD hydrolase family protein [Fretibacterium sp.]